MHVAAALRCATGNHMGFQHRAFEQEGHRLQELIDGESGYRILADYLGAELVFTIWSDLNPFVCVEPCWGLPDHQDQRPFEKKLGIQAIPSKDTLTSRFSMRFS